MLLWRWKTIYGIVFSKHVLNKNLLKEVGVHNVYKTTNYSLTRNLHKILSLFQNIHKRTRIEGINSVEYWFINNKSISSVENLLKDET